VHRQAQLAQPVEHVEPGRACADDDGVVTQRTRSVQP
jgi:hypothetical protein